MAFSVSALASGPAGSTWSRRVWWSDDGLPNNTIDSIAQTPDGYLWIASAGSLARFDGMRFEQFSPGFHASARAMCKHQ